MSVRVLALFSVLFLAACGGGGGGFVAPVIGLGQPPTDVIEVTNHNDAGPGSLRQAIDDAPSGAWIVFDPGLATGSIQLNSILVIDKVLTIGGLSGDGLRHEISGQNATGIFGVLPMGALQLNDLELVQGDSNLGGAVASFEGPVVLWRVECTDCDASESGGAIYVQDAPLWINDANFVHNCSDYGGAITTVRSTVRIERTAFYTNEAHFVGGAVAHSSGLMTLVNCAFHLNECFDAFSWGGAIGIETNAASDPTTLRAFNCTFTDNDVGDVGGAIRVQAFDVPAHVELQRCVVAENTAFVSHDLSFFGLATASGSNNLISRYEGFIHFEDGVEGNQVGTDAAPIDAMLLAPFTLPDGRVVRLPLPASPCVDAVPAGLNPNPEGVPMVVDLRFLPRDPGLPSDLGCCEL